MEWYEDKSKLIPDKKYLVSVSIKNIYNRKIAYFTYVKRLKYSRQIIKFKIAVTQNPVPHQCACNLCGHNIFAETSNTNGYCLCGHSCYQKGCKLCGSYKDVFEEILEETEVKHIRV